MKDLHFVRSVVERDIDLLLLEEFHVSGEFRSWFATQVGLSHPDQMQFVGAWHSVSLVSLGESDLILILGDPGGVRHAVLIENKVDAQPQPEQASRYSQRGDAGCKNGDWDEFRSCMVAPQQYLATVTDADRYDHQVSYETLRDWFAASELDRARCGYKARILDAAIDAARRGYEKIVDSDVTEFYADYYELVLKEARELNMRKPGEAGAQSDWIRFFPLGLPKGFRLRHKLRFGRVDLEMAGLAEQAARIRDENQHLLSNGMAVLPTTKSASICVFVPTVDRFAGVQIQIDEVREALAAAVRLWKMAEHVVRPVDP